MKSLFGILFSIKISHSYYPGDCEDFDFIIPPSTATALRNGRIIHRSHKGVFFALCEKNEDGTSRIPLGGLKIRIGLRLRNPNFSNFTPITNPAGTMLLYTNQGTPTMLGAGLPVVLTGPLFSHPVSKTDRPVTINVTDASDLILDTAVLNNADDTTPFPVDLRKYDSGLYYMVEKYSGGIIRAEYYVDQDLLGQNLYGVAEITIANGFSASPPELLISFAAREEVLKYYIIGKKYSSGDLNSIQVTDVGFSEEGRSQIIFQRVNQGSFTSGEIPPDLLTDENSKVVLFKSQSPIARMDRSRKKIQLTKSSDVIIRHLPQPGMSQQGSDMIIQISKP